MSSSITSRCFENNASNDTIELRNVDSSCTILKVHVEFLQQELSRIADDIVKCCSHEASDPSVYTGAPGIAFALSKVGSYCQSKELAANFFNRSDDFLSASHLDDLLKQANLHPKASASIMAGPAGFFLVQALAANRKNGIDCSLFASSVSSYLKYSKHALTEMDSDEWLYGRAGYLLGCIQLRAIAPKLVDDQILTQLADKIISSGEAYTAKTSNESIEDWPVMYEWGGRRYLGAAHGVIGIFFTLIHVQAVLANPSHVQKIQQGMRKLRASISIHGNIPAVLGETSDHLVHFCHGASGAVLLFCKAAQVWADEEWKETALRLGEVVWKYGMLKKGGGLCHGISGNGYCFLALYRITKDPKWLDRAVYFALNLFDAQKQQTFRIPDRPLSLYEGKAGWLCFISDLLYNASSSAFPLFEVEL